VAILTIVVSFHYMMGVRRPPYGDSFVIFFSTGILYHFSFMWMSMQGKRADMTGLPYPRIQDLDMILAGVFVQFCLMLTINISIALLLCALGLKAWPFDPMGAFLAFSLAGFFGLGVALINAVIVPIFELWHLIYQIFIRSALLLSGAFFVPDFIDPTFRYWMSWMPILHGISWFRASIIPGYPTLILDKEYYCLAVFITLAIAFTLERVTRRRRAYR
jgi:capsular polysaccharide transport system permease protein